MIKRISIFIMLLFSALMLTCAAFTMNLGGRVYASDTFTMVDGAFVRNSKTPYGIMFMANVPASVATDSNKSFHMLIIPQDYIDTYSLTPESDYYAVLEAAVGKSGLADMACIPFEKPADSGNWFIRGSLVNVKYTNLNRNFVGIAYYEEGGVRTYATWGENYHRSICNVASRYMTTVDYGTDEDVKEYIDDIIVDSYDSAKNNPQGTTDKVSDIILTPNYDEAILLKNDNTLNLSVEPSFDILVEWNSADAFVASVNEDGELTAVGGGDTIVTARALNRNMNIDVSVKDIPEEFENVYIDPAFTGQNISYYGVGLVGNSSVKYDESEGAYLHYVNSPYSASINKFTIDTDLIVAAIKDGLTTLSVDVKLAAGEGLLDSVNLKWRTDGTVIHESGTTAVDTNNWKTMTINLLNVKHYNSDTYAFVDNGDGTVTVNCSAFGISSGVNSGEYKVLFSNLRAGETTTITSGLYMKLAGDGTAFGREKLAFYSDGHAIVADGVSSASYQYKYYQNGYYKLCTDTTDKEAVIDASAVDLSDYTNTIFDTNANSYSTFDNNYSAGIQPIYRIAMNQNSESASGLNLNIATINKAAKEGYTVLNIMAKADQSVTDTVKLVICYNGCWAQQQKGNVQINNETYTLFSIDLKNLYIQPDKASSQKCVYYDEDAGYYKTDKTRIYIANSYQTLVSDKTGSRTVYFADYYFTK